MFYSQIKFILTLLHNVFNHIGRSAVVLPSTSPANAAWSLQLLAEAWRVIL